MQLTEPPIETIPDRVQTRLLARSFFDRDPREVGPDLLGKLIVRKEGSMRLAGRIVEVEAYLGARDAAAHSAAGRTERNDVLFGRPGRAYVYFIYGVHYCLNISCMPAGKAGCVLIRALEPLDGFQIMARARGLEPFNSGSPRDLRKLTSGPGRLCDALVISRSRDNGKDMVARKSDLQVRDDGFRPAQVRATRRIGITKSSTMPLRYIIAGNPFVSRGSTKV